MTESLGQAFSKACRSRTGSWSPSADGEIPFPKISSARGSKIPAGILRRGRIARASPMGKGRSMRPFPINERGQRFRLICSGGTTWGGTPLTMIACLTLLTVRWTVNNGAAWYSCLHFLDANALLHSNCSANTRRFPAHTLSVTSVKPPADGCSPRGRAGRNGVRELTGRGECAILYIHQKYTDKTGQRPVWACCFLFGRDRRI